MAMKAENQASNARAKPRRLAAVRERGRRIVRSLAQSTLIAAGFAATQFHVAEFDPRFRMFDRTLTDRLHAPISRIHE